MAAGRIVIPGWFPALDQNGVPIPNVVAFFYLNDTTTLATVYTNSTLTTPLPNPVPANASGQFPAIWADDANLFSVTMNAPYGPPGQPFTFDDLGPSTSTNAGSTANKLDRDGSNAEPDLAANIPFQIDAPQPADLSVASTLAAIAPLSADLFDGTGYEQLARASTKGGTKGRAVQIPAGKSYDISDQLPVQTTWVSDGPFTLTASAPTPFGILPGRMIQFSGVKDDTDTGPAYAANPMYIGPYSKAANRQYMDITGRADPLGEPSLAVASEWGHAGILAYSRTSDAPSAGFGTMGLFTYVMNDDPGGAKAGAAHYSEAIRLSGAGYTYVMEGDIMNFGSEVKLTPGNIYAGGASGGIWMASGGEPGPGAGPIAAASYAFAVVNNFADFLTGIVFGNNSLKRNAGGLGEAIAFGPSHMLRGYAENDQVHTQIEFRGDGATNRIRLRFDSSGFSFNELVSGANILQASAGGFQLGPEAGPWVNRPSPGNVVVYESVSLGGAIGSEGLRVLFQSGATTHALIYGSAGDIAVVGVESTSANAHILLQPKGLGSIRTSAGAIRDFADDSAAAAGGVPVEGLYRTGNVVKIRLT